MAMVLKVKVPKKSVSLKILFFYLDILYKTYAHYFFMISLYLMYDDELVKPVE